MKRLFLILSVLSFHFSLSQESSNEKIIGIWTVSDAGVTYFALCGTSDFSETIGTKFEFLKSGQLNIYEKKGNLAKINAPLYWNLTSEKTMTVKSKNDEIDLGRFKFYFSNNKLYLDNNIIGMTLERK